ncbi:hypothetical protein [Methylophaga pinxianii]|uniref:hypothetical protein n=1 Tax=Methylophaga pinxianii TaxID=2881052 RepID=UPI001CF2E5F1|nr:hypothetical protein [Methylophaga pinxianii]MCB2425698.1 hypothetical protein [Methylophaga pinxianii]UPH44706.1 hypothetical protein LGT42_009290 [Methylophaga pinxianii]
MKHNLSNTPLWEKLVSLMGFLLICFTVIYLVWSAFTNTDQSPSIHFSVVNIEALEHQYLVLVDVKNSGDKTASDLHLEGRLISANGHIQRSTSQVSYLAPESKQRVGFYFTSDPAQGELSFIPMGYQEP